MKQKTFNTFTELLKTFIKYQTNGKNISRLTKYILISLAKIVTIYPRFIFLRTLHYNFILSHSWSDLHFKL